MQKLGIVKLIDHSCTLTTNSNQSMAILQISSVASANTYQNVSVSGESRFTGKYTDTHTTTVTSPTSSTLTQIIIPQLLLTSTTTWYLDVSICANCPTLTATSNYSVTFTNNAFDLSDFTTTCTDPTKLLPPVITSPSNGVLQVSQPSASNDTSSAVTYIVSYTLVCSNQTAGPLILFA